VAIHLVPDLFNLASLRGGVEEFESIAFIHLRESHFFSLDVSMTFFTVVAWGFLVRTVERGDAVGAAGSALGLGLGVASKYSAAFIGPMIGIAELLSPFGPRGLTPIRPWIRVVVRTALTGLAGIAIFLPADDHDLVTLRLTKSIRVNNSRLWLIGKSDAANATTTRGLVQ